MPATDWLAVWCYSSYFIFGVYCKFNSSIHHALHLLLVSTFEHDRYD